MSSNLILKSGIHIAGVPVTCGYPQDHSRPPLTVVFVHGMFGSSKHFEKWMVQTVEAGFNACAIEMPSGKGTSFEDQLSDVETVIREIRVNSKDHSIILVGHASGGLVAQALCSRHEGLVDGLVLVASAAPQGIRQVASFWYHPRYLWASLTGKLFTLLDRHALDYVLNMYCDAEGKELLSEFKPESGRLLRDIAMGVKVGKIYHCKALIVYGAHDRMAPPEAQVELSERYDFDVFEADYGHMIPVEDNGDVFAKIRSMAIGVVCHKRRQLNRAMSGALRK